MFTLRSSSLADADALASCVDAVARERRHLAATEGFGAEATRRFLETLAHRDGTQVIAVADDGSVGGWCDILPLPHEGMRHVGQLGMGVAAAARGQGLGRRLLREALARAAGKDLHLIELEVFASNWPARRLYDREGFRVDGRRRGARRIDESVDDVVLMSLDLSVWRGGIALRAPPPIGSPVLDSVLPVVAASRHVRTNVDKLVEHARWMACEELPFPEFGPPAAPSSGREDVIDFVLVSTCINTAFTSFETGKVFEVEYAGRRWSDAEAMMACLRRALDRGVPVLDGRFLAGLTRSALANLFEGTIGLPMLDEKLAILNEVGARLSRDYGGRFHRFVESCPPRLYDNGGGLLERLVREFPRFDDVSPYRGHEVKFYKLAQLGCWVLVCGLGAHGGFRLDDLPAMTAFADYIVPMALRAMDILEYSPALDAAVANRRPIARDSEEEIEIRAHTIYATALLREEINGRRPVGRQVIVPQVDARLWQAFHAGPHRHHLTRTTMY